MKITGSELQLFIDQFWPSDDWYWDHEEFDDNPDPLKTYYTDMLGDLYWQGKPDECPVESKEISLDRLINKWRKERDFDLLTISIPKGQLDVVKAALAAVGVKP